jgi:hypothetical protein
VFAINPHTEEVEGDPRWPDLASVPGGVDAVVIGTRQGPPSRLTVADGVRAPPAEPNRRQPA